MVDIRQDATHGDEKATGRNRYERPTLKEFGPVGSLTQTGTRMTAESAGPNNPSRDIMG